MKKIIPLLLLLVVCNTGFAQGAVNQFIAKQAFQKGSENIIIRLSPLALALARPFVKGEAAKWLRKVWYADIFVIEGSPKNLGTDFENLSRKLEQKKFEPLLSIRSEGDEVKILAKTNRKEQLKHVVLMVKSEEGDGVLVRARGRFNLQDIVEMQQRLQKDYLTKR